MKLWLTIFEAAKRRQVLAIAVFCLTPFINHLNFSYIEKGVNLERHFAAC